MRTVPRLFAFVGRPGRGVFWLLVALLGLGGGAAQAQGPDWQLARALTTPNSQDCTVSASATDSTGNVYLAGTFRNTITLGNNVLTSAGAQDVFVARWESSSQQFAWAVRMGSGATDAVSGLAVSQGRVFVMGNFRAATAAFGSITLANASGAGVLDDGFVAKLTDTGTVAWAYGMGGTETDAANCVAVSGANVYVGGTYQSATASFGSTTITNSRYFQGLGTTQAFLAKLIDAGPGATFGWVQKIEGEYQTKFTALAATGAGLYAAVQSSSTTATLNGTLLPGVGAPDGHGGFILKFVDAGATTSVGWLQPLGSPSVALVGALATHGSAVYVGGYIRRYLWNDSTAVFGTTTLVNPGDNEAFVAKLTDASTSSYVDWAIQTHSSSRLGASVTGLGVADSSLYAVGMFDSPVVGFGSAGSVFTPAPGNDLFVAKIADAGPRADFTWVRQTTGGVINAVPSIALAGSRLYATSSTRSTTFFGSLPSLGNNAAVTSFLAAIDDNLPAPRLVAFSPGSGPVGGSVTLSGARFTNVSAVSFNGTPAPGFVVNSPTHITVAVPAGASSGRLSVTGPGGTVTSAGSFAVRRPAATAGAALAALALFPNPARTAAILTLPPAPAPRPVQVLDALGREVRQALLPAQATETSLNLAGLAPGVYAVRVGAATARLLVE